MRICSGDRAFPNGAKRGEALRPGDQGHGAGHRDHGGAERGGVMGHAEAFKLMLYRCQVCNVGEWIWNSRDGVTPFGIDCRRCGEDALHSDWHRDVYAPTYRPKPGERYFRDGLAAEARSIIRRRLESARGTTYELPEEEWPEMIERIVTPSEMGGEFQSGWPMLVVAGTDADTLPPTASARTASAP